MQRVTRNGEARSRYTAELFTVMLSIFRGTFIDRPQEVVRGQLTANGKIECVFYAFWTSDLSGNCREQAVAQVMAE